MNRLDFPGRGVLARTASGRGQGPSRWLQPRSRAGSQPAGRGRRVRASGGQHAGRGGDTSGGEGPAGHRSGGDGEGQAGGPDASTAGQEGDNIILTGTLSLGSFLNEAKTHVLATHEGPLNAFLDICAANNDGIIGTLGYGNRTHFFLRDAERFSAAADPSACLGWCPPRLCVAPSRNMKTYSGSHVHSHGQRRLSCFW